MKKIVLSTIAAISSNGFSQDNSIHDYANGVDIELQVRGSIEALTASDSLKFTAYRDFTGNEVVELLAGESLQLQKQLLNPNGMPRKGIEIIANGEVLKDLNQVISAKDLRDITVSDVVPCDG